jgi:hypothetical protein
MSAEGISGVRAEQLEEAMYEILEDLKSNPVSDYELQKVKNRLHVQRIRFMDIMSGIGILFYLGQNAAMGDWSEANAGSRMTESVTAADVQRVANKYFADDQRSVLIINAKGGPEEAEGDEDPRFAQAVQMIKSVTDADRLEQMIGMFSMRLDQVEDADERAQMEKLLKIANDHLETLRAGEQE